MPSIPESHKRNIFKYRTGQIWNKNVAFKKRTSYMPGQPMTRDAHCPPCRGDKWQGYIFGTCTLPDMSKQYIAEHDKAMRTVMQLSLKGSVVVTTWLQMLKIQKPSALDRQQDI